MRNLASAFALLIASSSFGCIIPGTYRLYRVAQESAEMSPACYGGNVPPSEVADSTTFKAGSTFGIYAHDSDTYFIDLEMESLEGKKKGSDYTFEGTDIDVEPDTPTAGDTTTNQRNLKIKLEISGRKIKGTSTETVASSCTGANCPQPTQCVTTIRFEGSEIRDVELEHPV